MSASRPSRMPPPPPLILSVYPHDIHAHAVCWGLRRHGIEPVWARDLADPGIAPVSLACTGDRLCASGALAPEAAGSVWFRRPAFPAAFPSVLEADEAFVRNEWKRFTQNAYAVAATLPGLFWVNPPDAAQQAENKLVQLPAAARCGLSYPPTLVSSDPARIREFVATHRDVVYKPFQTHSWQDGGGRMFSTYARTVDAGMLQDDASLRLCPGMFQRLVPKVRDVRVTVVGERCFAAGIQGDGDPTYVDWRASSIGNRVRSAVEALPPELERAIQALMRELGIVFGCVDLAVDAEGRYHFLEINQAGQFLFLEHDVPRLPILQAVCAMLAQATPAYDPAALPGISYAAYLDSAEHRSWWDRVSDGIRGADGAIPGVSLE